jgi:hypothetical protein
VKIFIPTKNRQDTISIPDAYQGHDWRVVVHSTAQRDLYWRAGRVPRKRIIVSFTPGDVFGLTRQREFVCNELVQRGDWFVFSDDNVRWVEGLPLPHYASDEIELPHECSKKWRALYRTRVTPARFDTLFAEMTEKAMGIGAHLCGFGTNDNYYFRRKHWSIHKYVIGKLMFVHNIGMPYDHTISMEDMRVTAEHLLRFGVVLVNNYVRPEAGHYEAGGMGTYLERIPQRRADCIRLLEMFPGLFRYRKPGNQKDAVADADLAFRLHSTKQIEKWRESMRAAVRYAGTREAV